MALERILHCRLQLSSDLIGREPVSADSLYARLRPTVRVL